MAPACTPLTTIEVMNLRYDLNLSTFPSGSTFDTMGNEQRSWNSCFLTNIPHVGSSVVIKVCNADAPDISATPQVHNSKMEQYGAPTMAKVRTTECGEVCGETGEDLHN